MLVNHATILKEMGYLISGDSIPFVAKNETQPNHTYSTHHSFWNYVNPLMVVQPYADARPPQYKLFPAGTTISELAKNTRLFVFIGASSSSQMQEALRIDGAIKLIFEPAEERIEAFVETFGRKKILSNNIFFFSGDPESTDSPLLWIVPADICKAGFPVFFVEEELSENLSPYVEKVINLMELFYYRHRLYALESQEFRLGRPIRKLVSEATYDRVKHHYENISPMLEKGTINDLKEAFNGETAVLVAAGPQIDKYTGWIRKNNSHAVIIAVNNALPTLIKEGIEPHFTIINDTSILSANAFSELPSLKRTRLVPHCLASIGKNTFSNIHFFGNDPTALFPQRDMLLLHGSVITAAFSLAEYLGCSRALLVGAQLASHHPFRLSYSKGSQHKDNDSIPIRDLTGQFPQLYPVKAADGTIMYTTPNFFDAAQWFIDRIRTSSLEVVNTTAETIIYGPRISIETNPTMPMSSAVENRFSQLKMTPPQTDIEKVKNYIKLEMSKWKERERLAKQAMRALSSKAKYADRECARLIQTFDQDNTSYMLQRFDGFDNSKFHALFFETPVEHQKKGMLYYFSHLQSMARELLDILVCQYKAIT